MNLEIFKRLKEVERLIVCGKTSAGHDELKQVIVDISHKFLSGKEGK